MVKMTKTWFLLISLKWSSLLNSILPSMAVAGFYRQRHIFFQKIGLWSLGAGFSPIASINILSLIGKQNLVKLYHENKDFNSLEAVCFRAIYSIMVQVYLHGPYAKHY